MSRYNFRNRGTRENDARLRAYPQQLPRSYSRRQTHENCGFLLIALNKHGYAFSPKILEHLRRRHPLLNSPRFLSLASASSPYERTHPSSWGVCAFFCEMSRRKYFVNEALCTILHRAGAIKIEWYLNSTISIRDDLSRRHPWSRLCLSFWCLPFTSFCFVKRNMQLI